MPRSDNSADVLKVLSLMKRIAGKVTVIEYPDSKLRSVDLVVEPKSGVQAIVRISPSVSNRKKDFVELKRISEFLDVNALVIANVYNKEKLLENVLYIRGRVGIISPKTLESLCREEPIYVYEYQGSYYVKVKGEALRELRSKYRLGYSMLAKMVGLTAKALYEYEQGKMGMSVEVAERFLEIFGDDFERVLDAIDVFSFRIISRKSDRSEAYRERINDKKSHLAEKIEELGIGNAEVFNHIPPDIVVKSEHSKAFIALVSKGNSIEQIAKKCRENVKLAHELGGHAITMIEQRDRDIEYLAEECSDVISESVEDIAEFVYKESRR